jgi:hypothetical protein
MAAVARELQWAMISSEPEPSLLLDRRGYRGRVEYRAGSRPATDVSFDLDGAVNGWLQVAPESVAHGMIRTFGLTDVTIGDERFDAAFEVSAISEEFARRLLDPDNRSLLQSLEPHGHFVFRVTPHLMLLRAERHIYDPVLLEGLIVAASNLFGSLDLPERGTVEVQEVADALSEGSQCEICGTGLAAGLVVRCARCRTPHHRECWEFNGVCSTFACGSKEFA